MVQKCKRVGSFPLELFFPPVNYTLAGEQIMRWPGRLWWHSFSFWALGLSRFLFWLPSAQNPGRSPMPLAGSTPLHFYSSCWKVLIATSPKTEQGRFSPTPLVFLGLTASLPWHTTKPSHRQEAVFALNILGKAASLSARQFPNMPKGKWYLGPRLDQEV